MFMFRNKWYGNTLSSMTMLTKFLKSRKRRNKKTFLTSLRKSYSIWIAFYCFVFKTKLLNLFSSLRKKHNFELNHDFQDICSLMIKVNYTVHKLWFKKKQKKKTDVYIWNINIWNKFSTHRKVNIKKYFSEYIFKQLKYHQHRIRNEFGISLDNILNDFKYLTVSPSTLILILSIVPLPFISVIILCKFAMLPDMYMLLSPQEKEVHSSS